MEQLPDKRDKSTAEFHPLIYKVAAGLFALFAVAAWATFFRTGETGENLVAVTFLFVVAGMIPYLLWLSWKHHQTPQPTLEGSQPFRDWTNATVEVWGSRVKGKDAAINALLPIASVAVGMVLYGVAFDIVRHMVG